MSYNLHRLQVAEVARHISDAMPRNASDATCELILSLDSKLEALVQSLPAFFRVEIADSDEIARICRTHPHLPLQRLVINLMVDLVRCKLHYSFLSGHSNKSLHTFSRDASLKAARRVLSAHRDMSMLEIFHSSDFMKIQGTIFHMFIGALILATDLCCNQPQGEERERQSAEVMMVLRQLDSIRLHSQSAASLLETLTQLLIQYGVWAPDTIIAPAEESHTNVDSFGQDGIQVQEFDNLAPFPFEELWDTFVERPTIFDLIDSDL